MPSKLDFYSQKPSGQAGQLREALKALEDNAFTLTRRNKTDILEYLTQMDAVQSLEYIADLNGMAQGTASDKIWELLKEVGLTDSANKKVGTYSRGMRQRLGIAEVLIKDPKVLFLDEPTLGLDPDGALRIIELIQSLNRDKNMTVLLSSHNLHQVQKISHRVGIMIKGKMVATGSIENLSVEKFGVGEEEYTLEEIYMKYFQEV